MSKFDTLAHIAMHNVIVNSVLKSGGTEVDCIVALVNRESDLIDQITRQHLESTNPFNIKHPVLFPHRTVNNETNDLLNSKGKDEDNS